MKKIKMIVACILIVLVSMGTCPMNAKADGGLACSVGKDYGPDDKNKIDTDDYWNQHTARLNGETLERYKVIVTEVSPGDTAIRTEVELERTITLDEILAGAV